MKDLVRSLIGIVSETWTIAWEREANDSEAHPAALVVQMPKYLAIPEKLEKIEVDTQEL